MLEHRPTPFWGVCMTRSLFDKQPASERITALDIFEDRHKFQDDVHGEILLNTVERDIIDTPEFQRLSRIGQMGFVKFVYPTANHTRASHSIGVCHLAGRLMDRLEHNHKITRNPKLKNLPVLPFARSERILIRLAALLHDISHGPFSHDIEKKKHIIRGTPNSGVKGLEIPVLSGYGVYSKHDDYENNPILYLFLFDAERSVLARALQAHSPDFWHLMQEDAKKTADKAVPSVKSLVGVLTEHPWQGFEREILPALLFHLLIHERIDEKVGKLVARRFKAEDRLTPETAQPWGLGPNNSNWEDLHSAWYQPYRHDIIGNTLSADLLDYLQRDAKRTGLQQTLDLYILNYYVLARVQEKPEWYRCAIDLIDHKRGPVRNELLNDIFRVLDLRHEIHEKAVMHRMVQASNAMMSRALLFLRERCPSPEEIIGLGCATGRGSDISALAGDEHFMQNLLNRARPTTNGDGCPDAHHLLLKLSERRLYRPLMVIPGDRVRLIIPERHDSAISPEVDELIARRMGALVASPMFAPFFLFISAHVERFVQHAFKSSQELIAEIMEIAANSSRLQEATDCVPRGVIIWTTPYKQLYKDPALTVLLPKAVSRLDNLPKPDAPGGESIDGAFRDRVTDAIRHADSKYSGMWNLYVFVSDGLFYAGTIAKLRPNHPCNRTASSMKEHPHLLCLEEAVRLLAAALCTAWRYWVEGFDDNSFRDPSKSPIHKPMTADKLGELLQKYAQDCPRYAVKPGLSAVSLEQLFHGDPDAGSANRERCRDVRYKFDSYVSLRRIAEDGNPPGDLQSELATLLRHCHAPDKLAATEFDELFARYRRPEVRQRCEEFRARLNERALTTSGRNEEQVWIDELINLLW